MRNIRANIETGAQIIIAIAVVAIAIVVVKRYVAPPQLKNDGVEQARMLVGTRINGPNVDWEQNKNSLVFFLKKDCIYCEASAHFYRQLIDDASQRNVKWLAILPNSVDEGKEYVRSLELPIENVKSAPLSAYKISGTPSLLFVDDQGMVKGVWVGATTGRETKMREELVALFNAKSN